MPGNHAIGEDIASLLASSGIGTWVWDPASNHVRWDATTHQIYGVEVGGFDGTFDSYASLIHEEDRTDVLGLIQAMSARGGDYSTRHRIVRPSGEVIWIEGQGRIVVEGGMPTAGYGVVYDITDRVTMEAERDRLRVTARDALDARTQIERDLAYVMEVGNALTGSMNPISIVERLAAFIVPQLAERVTIDLLIDDVKHTIASVVCDLDGRPQIVASNTGAAERLRLPGGSLDGALMARAGLDTGGDAGALAALALPINARGTRIGMVLAERVDGTWSDRIESLLSTIVARSAVAIESSLLFESHATASRMLTRTIQPPEIVQPDEFDVSGHYRAATDVARLGGDFFDFFETGDREWMAILGDVTGKGTEAAASAGLLRSALRSAALTTGDPHATAVAANRVLRLEPERTLATAVLVRFTALEGRRRFEIVSAGHPPPLLMGRRPLDESKLVGTMLGLVDEPEFGRSTGDMEFGESMVLYSDGVTDARLGSRLLGRERLVQACDPVSGEGAAAITRALVVAVESWTAGRPVDDVTVLTITAR